MNSDDINPQEDDTGFHYGDNASQPSETASSNPFDMKTNPSNISFDDDDKKGSLMLGIIFAASAAFAGGAAWALFAYCTHHEFALLAWGIGALVGLAMRKGHKRGSFAAGALAVVLSLSGILTGKILMDETTYTSDETVKAVLNHKEILTTALYQGHCLLIKDEKKMSAESITFLDEMIFGDRDHFPEEMTREQDEAWAVLEKRVADQSYENKAAAIKRLAQHVAATRPLAKRITDTLSPFDVLSALLAIASSFKLASGTKE